MKKDKSNELEVKIKEIRMAIQDCFGLIPVSCDGAILVSLEKYNKLAETINKINSKKK